MSFEQSGSPVRHCRFVAYKALFAINGFIAAKQQGNAP